MKKKLFSRLILHFGFIFHWDCHNAFWRWHLTRFWSGALVSGSIRLSKDPHLSQQPTWCQTPPPLPIFLCSYGLLPDVISHWCSRKHICVLTQTPSCCPGSLPVPKHPHFPTFGLCVRWWANGLIGKQPVVQHFSSVKSALLKIMWSERAVKCPKQEVLMVWCWLVCFRAILCECCGMGATCLLLF